MPKTNKKKHSSAPKRERTVAFEAKHQDGGGIVGIGNLNVVILQEDGAWFAQGLEIDYLAQGKTMKEAKQNFEKGLCATLHENAKKHGSIQRVLRFAPNEIWDELVYNPDVKLRGLSMVSIRSAAEVVPVQERLPFRNIRYVEQELAASA